MRRSMHPFNGRRSDVSVAPFTVRPSVIFIDTIDKYYEHLDGHMNAVVAQYDAGLISEPKAVA